MAYVGGLDKRSDRLVTTAINVAELYHGAARSSRRLGMVLEIEGLVDELVVLNVDLEVAKLFGTLDAHLSGKGRAVPFTDLLIAAVLLRHGESRIATRNAKDFRSIPGMVVDEY